MIKNLFRICVFITLIATISMPAAVKAAQSPQNVHAAARPSPAVANALAWYDGMIQYSSVTNCFSIIQGSPYTEYGVGTYVGFQADPNNSKPAPNVTYYVHVVIAGLGNPCSGGTYAYIDISLPPGTSVSVDPSNPIRCFHDNAPIAPSDCFQSLSPSSYNNNAQAILSPDNAHGNTWPVAQGHSFEFQIPVRSTAMLVNSPFQANILALDGNSSPWLHPQQGIYVFNGTPQITYPNPSTTQITKTTAYSQAYLYTGSTTGTGYFDLGITTSYGLRSDAVAIVSPGSLLAWDDWLPVPFAPNTLYHWRFRYVVGAQTYYGIDQTFLTLSDGTVSVGQGATADCTESAFNTALAANKPISFNCGPTPVTITLTSVKTISASNLVIDGGGKVTLASSGSSNLFNLQAGAHLTLKKLTLSGGVGGTYPTCGGAIYVPANAQLDVSDTKFLNNQSISQGGAICNYGTATITNSLFQNNSSSFHGGAIMNAGSLSITGSKFESNTASANGGAIDTGGTIVVNLSTFNGNTAGLRGGGINAYFANLSIAATTFSGNTANMYGGGLASDASTTSVSASTFSGNNAPLGGGIEMNADGGTSALTLTNTTVTANNATAGSGGGLYWAPGVNTESATLVNTTFAANTATAVGGNIYAGGVNNPSLLVKNTIISGGSPNNCDHVIGSQGHNLESTNTCGLNAAGDLINKLPLLAPLQNNGGATMTRLLNPGSPAIDAGTNTGCPAVDQRGQSRPLNGMSGSIAACDIGAVEVRFITIYLPVTVK